jgi:hypothetical protein
MIPVEKQFVINATQERVWGLLGGAIYQCLPVEKVDVILTNTYKYKVGLH